MLMKECVEFRLQADTTEAVEGGTPNYFLLKSV
jgi:hypothetical protein